MDYEIRLRMGLRNHGARTFKPVPHSFIDRDLQVIPLSCKRNAQLNIIIWKRKGIYHRWWSVDIFNPCIFADVHF